MMSEERKIKSWRSHEIRIIAGSITFFVIFIILFVIFSPGITYGFYTSPDDIEFTVSSTKTVLSVNETEFPVTFVLHNKRSYPVCVDKRFELGNNIYLSFTFRFNRSDGNHTIGKLFLNYPPVKRGSPEKEWLVKDKRYTVNLAKYTGWYGINDTKYNFSWNQIGNYSLTARYSSPELGIWIWPSVTDRMTFSIA